MTSKGYVVSTDIPPASAPDIVSIKVLPSGKYLVRYAFEEACTGNLVPCATPTSNDYGMTPLYTPMNPSCFNILCVPCRTFLYFPVLES